MTGEAKQTPHFSKGRGLTADYIPILVGIIIPLGVSVTVALLQPFIAAVVNMTTPPGKRKERDTHHRSADNGRNPLPLQQEHKAIASLVVGFPACTWGIHTQYMHLLLFKYNSGCQTRNTWGSSQKKWNFLQRSLNLSRDFLSLSFPGKDLGQ